ncbi:hypothetical protein ACR799_14600 [Clavibacter sepedonicus]|uniref:Uncharacterized protein n=1 Tax=Clavibacter sepedonicus TaxID=31964 RepID=B0RJ80_CLASE|nr:MULTISPECIES: hypothetical protein [Clavibacter]MBD5382569.1 hypothetical protein [Clavibacter sp.]OQJ45219.1 hypothetical protein B5P19_15240 [Clavibacter sepedonicus]OQJ50854.1 hypothetical protein B5P20_15575 [Clavibacter sepedonicus]UUK67347.1 hypothetical protein LRE50_16440 [Clavibacter sepedonicus]CAQ03270.1 hypothetical protein pCSL0025 [Clavibacter sepedonicus]
MTANRPGLFTEEEWRRFCEAARQSAAEAGGIFILNEMLLLVSERSWMAHVRAQMIAAGVDDLAACIDPLAFPGIEQSAAWKGAKSNRRSLTAAQSVDELTTCNRRIVTAGVPVPDVVVDQLRTRPSRLAPEVEAAARQSRRVPPLKRRFPIHRAPGDVGFGDAD